MTYQIVNIGGMRRVQCIFLQRKPHPSVAFMQRKHLPRTAMGGWHGRLNIARR